MISKREQKLDELYNKDLDEGMLQGTIYFLKAFMLPGLVIIFVVIPPFSPQFNIYEQMFSVFLILLGSVFLGMLAGGFEAWSSSPYSVRFRR